MSNTIPEDVLPYTRFIIERKHPVMPSWEPYAFPQKGREEAIRTLAMCREREPRASFRLILETREVIV